MKRIKYILTPLLMVSSCSNASGEAISAGDEGYFQITPAPEARGVVSNTQKKNIAPKSETKDEKAFVGFEKVYRDFIKAHDKRGMVVGRGNVQGIAEARIMVPELKGLSWLFVEPGVGGFFRDNAQDVTQGNALATTWPVDFSTNDAFDAVVFDYGTIQYIGDDGSDMRLGQEYFAKQMALVITKADGTQISKTSFDAPYKFQDWLIANKPAEFLPLESQYWPQIQAARERQRKTLKKGLLDAYLALKRGGVLILPIDGSIDEIDLVNLLSISEADLVLNSVTNGNSLTESPVLPENEKGMGTSYGDYYSIIRK